MCTTLTTVFLTLLAQGVEANLRHVGHRHASSLIRGLEFKHRLRVCNAYPYSGALDLYRGKEMLTGPNTPGDTMPYKACEDFKAQLKAGDKLEFKVGDAMAGTFSISDLPNNDAVLLLVIYRHDTLSTAVSFESHVFANLLNAQVAVIDTYKGSGKSVMKIKDSDKSKSARTEDLRYDSVVALNQGEYQVTLVGTDGATKSTAPLVAINRDSYVILRVGCEAQSGPQYPQELVVYPQSDPALLKGASMRIRISSLLIAVATYVWLF